MWFNKLIQIFKIHDLRNKLFFVLFIFAVFRLMANIPVPGVNLENLKMFFASNESLSLLNLFTGGALERSSIVMLGLGPYITSVIILQLLTMIFPQLEKMYKEEGEAGRRKFNQYGRILTVPFAALQGFAMLSLLQRQSPPVVEFASPVLLLAAVLSITAGAVFLMWLGELITERGIGNGVSLLIFAGIIAAFPMSIYQSYFDVESSPEKTLSYVLFFVLALVIIFSVVLVNEARRNIPVSYAKRVRGMKMYGGVSTYLPLNLNPAGVIPIIFALAIMLFPGMIASFLGGVGGMVGNIAQTLGNLFDPQRNLLVYGMFYFILVVLFTFFYTAVTFDPKAIATNLQKMGGFVPGIRPGSSTANFLKYILNRVLLFGALFLGLIAVMPFIVSGITSVQTFSFLIGGTSLLIIVSVVLETIKQINSQLQMRDYDTF
ncbi:preprotein translocase subunit SecY [Candidatus Parcubacteria bacterium]|nr:preprotein translocase subunit SecY [Candidatus Parcubacteria bacterium]